MFNLDYISEEDIIEDVQVYDPRDSKDYCLLPLKLAIDELDQFCLYVSTTQNADAITHSALMNLKTMFEMLDKKPYRTNDSAKARLEYIKLALEARVDLNLTSKTLIKQHILRNCDSRLKETIDQEIVKPLVGQRMANDTCKYINTMVFENLINGWSLTCSKELYSLLEKKDNGLYSRISDFSNDLKKLIGKIDIEIRKSEEYKRDGKGFDLTTDNIKGEVNGILNELTAPSNKLRTGIQFLNKMLNGGFESGRSYLFMGVTGVGKSVILLSCALWIIKYNRLPVIDGKKQAVLFISQENSKSETFERIFNINVSGDDIRNFSEEQIIEGLESAGLINKKDDTNSIDFIFRYFSDKEIGVSDIDSMISDFDRKGIQIIAVVQDYIEKLKPKLQYTELRHSLGSVATEMAELAKARSVPFISAAQLNRTASSVVADAVSNNKTNTTKLLGKANVSESWDMMKNTDSCIIINREVDDTQESKPQYLGFKLEKFRGKPNKDGIYMFLHPFDEHNPILLIPDIEGKPLSRLSIEEFNPLNDGSKRQYTGRPTFGDPPVKDEGNGFLDYCSSLGEDYEDSFETIADVCKSAEVAVSQRIKELHDREEELRKQRKAELRKMTNIVTHNGYVIIHSRNKKIAPKSYTEMHRIRDAENLG